MAERIPMRYTVALQGFSEFERNAMASFFRLGQHRAPSYERGQGPAASDFIIADADAPADVAAVREIDRLQDAIFIGASSPTGAAAWMPRPIDPSRILRELDRLLEQRLALLDEPPRPVWVASGLDPLADRHGRPARNVLVVDDSRVAAKFLEVRLQGLGYRVEVALDAHHAITLLDTRPFSIVFLDIHLGDGLPDGFSVCQHLKRRGGHPGGVTPSVVIVTGSTSSTDRVRGDLAGCDAYLIKPLMEDEFVAALSRLDPSVNVQA